MTKNFNKLNRQFKVYDSWLSKFDNYIENEMGTIIDLGCWIGSDTLYLNQKGKKVLSVDFSKESLKILKENIFNANVKYMDMENNYSLENNSVSLIISSLSIHYFDEENTIKLIKNIKNTLKEDGIFIFRVNSINDKNYGANNITNSHFLKVGEINKRFFDIEDIKYFFKD